MIELRAGFIAVSDNNIVQIWDLGRTQAYKREVIHHEDQIVKFIALDDGDYVASVARDKKIIVWNTLDCEVAVIKNTGHSDIITDMVLVNDKLLTTCFDGNIKEFRMLYKRQLTTNQYANLA